MKKRTIGLISALLAVLLLAGCGSVQKAAESIAEAVSGSSFSGARRSPDMVHFDDMEYVRRIWTLGARISPPPGRPWTKACLF